MREIAFVTKSAVYRRRIGSIVLSHLVYDLVVQVGSSRCSGFATKCLTGILRYDRGHFHSSAPYCQRDRTCGDIPVFQILHRTVIMQSGRKTTRRQTKQSPKLTPYSDNSASTDRPALFQDGVNRIQSPASSSGRGQRRQSIHPIHKAEAPINQSTLSSKYANTRPHINGVAVQSAECMQSSSAALPVEGSLHSKVFAAETPLEHASLTSFCDKLTTSNHPSGSSKRRISVSEGVADHLRHAPSTAAGRLAHANSQGGRDLGTSNPLQSFINGMADWLVPGMNPGDAFMAHMYNSGLMSPQQKAMLGMSQDASFPIGFNSQIFGSLNKPMSQFRGVTRPLFTASWDAHVCVQSTGERVFLGRYELQLLAITAINEHPK